MADLKYIIKLVDGKTLTLSSNSIKLYPHIQDQISDISGNEVFLEYSDTEALHLILTTDFLEQEYAPDMHIRLISAVEYLGNENMLDTMLKILLTWFNNPDILAQLKQDKEFIKKLISTLSVPVLWRILQFFTVLEFEYQGVEFMEIKEIDAASDDLNYIILKERDENNKIEIWHKGQLVKELEQIFPNSIIGRAIKDNGDIYYVDETLHPNRIMKYVGAEIMANDDQAIIPQRLRDITLSNIANIIISRDGTKFIMVTTLPNDDRIKRFEVRNMDTNDVILTRNIKTGNTKYYTSPRMNVIIETDPQLQYYITNKNGTSIPINIPHTQDLTSDDVLYIYIQCNDLSYQRKYNPEYHPWFPDIDIKLKLKLIFSYDENKFIEWGHVPQTVSPLEEPLEVGSSAPRPSDVPTSQFLKSPDRPINTSYYHHIVRILDVSGNVLVDYFVTEEEPVGISNTMFLTRVGRTEHPVHNGNIITEETVKNVYILVRSLNDIQGPIVQEIAGPTQHAIEYQDAAGISCLEFAYSFVNGVIPGKHGSFMFLHNRGYPIVPEGSTSIHGTANLDVLKYKAEVRYKNMAELLDDKFKD